MPLNAEFNVSLLAARPVIRIAHFILDRGGISIAERRIPDFDFVYIN